MKTLRRVTFLLILAWEGIKFVWSLSRDKPVHHDGYGGEGYEEPPDRRNRK